MYEILEYLVYKVSELLSWLSLQQVKAARVRLRVLYRCQYNLIQEKEHLEGQLAELEQDELALQNEIVHIQDFIDSPAKEL